MKPTGGNKRRLTQDLSDALIRRMESTSPIQIAIDEAGGATALATALRVSVQAIGGWKNGDRPVPPERCAEIERITQGKVTADSLSPRSRWVRVPDDAWPHPGGRPLLDVATPREPEVATEGRD